MTLKNRMRSIGLIAVRLLFTLILAGCGTLQVSVQVQEATTPSPTSTHYVFADSIVLAGYSLPSLEVPINTQLLLRLYWQVTDHPSYPYALGIGLRGADRTLVWNAGGQTISWIRGRLMTEHYLQFPEQVGEGDYDLEVWLYNPNTGEKASVNGLETGIVRVATLHLTQEHLSPPQISPTFVVPFTTSYFHSDSQTVGNTLA